MGKHLGTQKSIRFSEDELALLDRLAEKHGTIKNAVMAGLRALDGRADLTDQQLLDMLKARLNL